MPQVASRILQLIKVGLVTGTLIKRKVVPVKPNRVDTTVGLDLLTASKIRKLAAQFDRSVASMLRVIVRDWLKSTGVEIKEPVSNK